MFDWQTEDDTTDWNEPQPSPKTAVSRRVPWVIIWVGLLIGIAGGVVYYRVQAQITQQMTAVEQEVVAIHQFVYGLGQQGDLELFRAQLSGRDPAWTASQLHLVEQGLLLDRQAFGFSHPGIISDTDYLTVTLSPDLLSAEVTAVYRYVVQPSDEMSQTLWLQQTAVYRRSIEQKWLLSPPLNDFWGGWDTINTHYLTLTYPRRDATVAEQLALDLDDALRQMCQLEDIGCPPDLHVQIRLSVDPQHLLESTNPAAVLRRRDIIELPTPTLLGVPLNDAGYRALSRGYGVQVVSAVITQLVGYDCCQHVPLYLALLAYQLDELKLSPWPLTPTDYDELLEGFNNQVGYQIWQNSDPSLTTTERTHVYSLVAFTLSETASGNSIADMQRHLSDASNYMTWLRQFLPADYDIANFGARWRGFIYQQSAIAHIPPPIPWPQEAVTLSCQVSETETVLYWYVLETAEWQPIAQYTSAPTTFMNAMTPLRYFDEFGVWEVGYNDDTMTQTTRFIIMQGQQKIIAFEIEHPFSSYYGIYQAGLHDRSERYWWLRLYGNVVTEYEGLIVDLQNCQPGNCPLHEVVGWPGGWSPDSSQFLWQDWTAPEGFAAVIYRGNAVGETAVLVGPGAAPFWLNNERYGYLRPLPTGEYEIMAASTADDVPQVLVSPADLLNVLPEAERPLHLFIQSVDSNPVIPDQLIVLASDLAEWEGTSYLFWVDTGTESRQLSLLYRQESEIWAEFSENGRFIQVYDFSSAPSMRFIELETGETHLVWLEPNSVRLLSPDSQWVVENNWEERLVTFKAVGYEYQREIPYYMPACSSDIRWVREH